jgi:hypothetical protein
MGAGLPNETCRTETPCPSRCGTTKILPCSKAMSTKHRPKFCRPWPTMVTPSYIMSIRFSSGYTINQSANGLIHSSSPTTVCWYSLFVSLILCFAVFSQKPQIFFFPQCSITIPEMNIGALQLYSNVKCCCFTTESSCSTSILTSGHLDGLIKKE